MLRYRPQRDPRGLQLEYRRISTARRRSAGILSGIRLRNQKNQDSLATTSELRLGKAQELNPSSWDKFEV
jgi:hypothetical protein